MNAVTETSFRAAANPVSAEALSLAEFWMPFTANRQFKKSPRLLSKASGMYYYTPEGREILDCVAGLWCVNAGHGNPHVVRAIQQQAAELDFASTFQVGHPKAFELATRLSALAPKGLNRVFFANSGSESVETALKIALAYHRARGEGTRTRLIGRERGYHGVNFGGISVGGIPGNRKVFGAMVSGTDHLRSTHDPARNAFSKGQPAHGAEFADELERLIALHDPSNIAAVIVEPLAGSTGVLIPPAGYLQRIRELCSQHGILLIFDEVITGFGRLGSAFAAQRFGVTPDLMTVAKGITNGAVPMGAVFARQDIHDAFMQGPEHMIELYHGYTYSGHPLACAAGLGALQAYEEGDLFKRAAALEPLFEAAVHSLKGSPHVVDIRNLGLVGGIELEPRAGEPGRRAFDAFVAAWEEGLLIRVTGDIIALSPPLIVSEAQIEHMVSVLKRVLHKLA
jgi:beta-alanine--pyruvate transaminase